MGQFVLCVHKWSDWFERGSDDSKRWRICGGLCKRVQSEGDEEPRVEVARIE